MKCIDDFIKGNLEDAKQSAKHVSRVKLFHALTFNYAFAAAYAVNVIQYLKGKITFHELSERAYAGNRKFKCQ